MFDIEKISINFAFGTIFFFTALILLILYSIYTYRHTVPEISTAKKVLLVFLRVSALLLVLFMLFEPVLIVDKKEYNRPVNLIFIDNSRSLSINDGTSRQEAVKSFVSGLNSRNISENSLFYTFGNEVNQFDYDSLKFNFNEGVTNISDIFKTVEESKQNVSSVVIATDGVITEGSNPVYKAAELNIPVFTLGIGDSSRKNDIQVTDVLYNDYIYSGVSTVISVSLLNTGYYGRKVTVSLSENGKTAGQQNAVLGDEGIQELRFEYKPGTPGEKKMTVSVSDLEGEQSIDNNRRVFFINVLSSKIKVLVLAGSPSPDLSFISNTLKQDQNLSVTTITQIGSGRFLEKFNRERAIDTSDILFLVGFPSKQTDDALLKKVLDEISINKKPYFMVFSDGVDFNKLNKLQNELPFSINRVSEGYSEALPDINTAEIRNPLLYSGDEKTSAEWNSLPPVYMINSEVSVKPETKVLATVKIRNIPVKKPLIVTRKLGSRKSAVVLGKDIWRWKLQTAAKNLNIFDNFLLNNVKWLNTGEDQKQVVVRTSKKLYSLGEEITFTAQVYDAAFNPVPDANVDINIRTGDESSSLSLIPLGNGLYEGSFERNKTGDYFFTGTASLDNEKIGSDRGSFNIGEVDIEMLNPRMNYELLSLLASETKGRFFIPAQQEELFKLLKQRVEKTSDVKLVTSEFSLWSSEWILIIVVLLFALEWFIRKQSGML